MGRIHCWGYSEAITLVPEEEHANLQHLARLTLAMMESMLEEIYGGLYSRLKG